MNDLVAIAKGDVSKFITDLIESKGANLPAKIDEVLEIFEFTDWKAKAWKIMSDKMARLEDQSEAYHSALRSGQHWGIAALYAQKRMGEITPDIRPEYPARVQDGLHNSYIGANKAGISRGIYQDAEQLAKNSEILDRVIEDAKERGEIPTKQEVIREIKREKEVLFKEQHQAPQPKPDLTEHLEKCIDHINQVNIFVGRFFDHPDQVDPERMTYFVQRVKRLVEIITERTEEIEKWKLLK